jgi:hypothetical protein
MWGTFPEHATPERSSGVAGVAGVQELQEFRSQELQELQELQDFRSSRSRELQEGKDAAANFEALVTFNTISGSLLQKKIFP